MCLLFGGWDRIATGRGDQLSLPSLDHLYVVLGKYRSPGFHCLAYQTHRQQFGSSYVADLEKSESRAFAVHSGQW